jgi:hypothetical protein
LGVVALLPCVHLGYRNGRLVGLAQVVQRHHLKGTAFLSKNTVHAYSNILQSIPGDRMSPDLQFLTMDG